MNCLWWAMGGLVAYFLVGAIALASIDDGDLSLLLWADQCPIGGWAVVVAWPVVTFFWLRRDER